MRNLLNLFVIALPLLMAETAGAQAPALLASTPAKQAESAQCARLRADYEKLEKRLSRSAAEGAMGSAKSLKLRATEDQSLVSLAQMTLDGFGPAGCAIPDGPPSAVPYLLAALKCEKAKRVAKTGAASPPSCDTATWQPFKE